MASTSQLPAERNPADDCNIAEIRDDSKIAESISVSVPIPYQGFDPKVILTQLLRNRKSYEAQKLAPRQWDLKNVDNDFKMTTSTKKESIFSNQQSILEDIHFLTIAFFQKNRFNDNYLKKGRRGIDEILGMLKDKYDINDEVHKSGTILGSRVVTAPRIANIFPCTAVRMFHDKIGKEIVPYDSFPGTVKPATHAISCPLLPSVCPATITEGNNFHPVMIWTAIKFDDHMHRNERTFTSLIGLLRDYRTSFQSPATPEGARLKVFRLLELITSSESKDKEVVHSLTTEAKALVSSCMTSLGQMRLADQNHELMMNVAKSGDLTSF